MLRRAQWIVAVFVYSVCALVCVAACGRRTPELMAVSGLGPTSVTENDFITLSGEGFVVGPEANIRFVGRAYRPGQEAAPIDVKISGSAVDGENLEVVVSAALVRQMCGPSDDVNVTHATFRGDVEASFAPRTKGAPPIVGRLRGIELDVFRNGPTQTGPSPIRGASKNADPSALVETLGFALAENASNTLQVTRVDDNRPAHLANLRVGDVLHRWSGVRVYSMSDIDVYPGQRVVVLEVLREGQVNPVELGLDVEGLAPLGAQGWNVGLLLLGVLIVGVMVSRSRLSQWLVWLAVAKPETRKADARGYGVLPFLVVSAAFLALGLRRDFVPFDMDLPLVALLCSLALGFFAVGLAFNEQGFSLRSLLRVWFWQLPLHLVLAITVGVLVLERGHASVWELGAIQDIGPLSYGAFASPPSFLVTVTWVALSVVIALSAGPVRRRGHHWLRAWTHACGDTASLTLSALVLAVFLGGWSTGDTPPRQLGWLEALYFQVRFTVLFFVFGLCRRYIPSTPLQAVSVWAWKVLVPAALGALLLLPVWWAEIWPAWVRVGAKSFLLGVACVVVVGLPVSGLLLRRLANTTGRRTGLNPWL